MIKYLGSKRALLPWIVETIQEVLPSAAGGHVLDLFSGTSRVGHALKGQGYRVTSNDWNRYASTLARCYVEADLDRAAEAQVLLDHLNQLSGEPGYFTQTFCENARFFQPHNGARIDAIRAAIAAEGLSETDPELEAILLTSLMEAADRVDSTTGVQMAYLKDWAPRSYRDLELRLPQLLPRAKSGKGRALSMDALQAATSVSADLAYLDPPYNQHKYLGNYHIWETLVRNDEPEHYGVACKRVDVRQRKSPFNSKPRIAQAMRELVDRLDSRWLVVSFSNEGHLDRDEMESILSARGKVQVREREHQRYVGAKIGIHSPEGERVGAVTHTQNREFLFLVGS